MMRCSWRVQTSARGSTLVLRAVPNVNLRSLKQKQRASYRCRLVSVTLLNQIVLIFDLETQPTLTQVTSPQGKSTNLAMLPLEPLKALNKEVPGDMMLLTIRQCKCVLWLEQWPPQWEPCFNMNNVYMHNFLQMQLRLVTVIYFARNTWNYCYFWP